MISDIKLMIFYFNKFTYSNKYMRIILILGLLLIILSNWIETILIQKISKFIENMISEGQQLLIFIIIGTLLSNSFIYISNILYVYLVTYLIEKGYLSFFKEFLYLSYSEFNKYSIGEIQHCIQRRVVSLGIFFQAFTTRFLINLMLFIIIIVKICFFFPIISNLKIIFIVIMLIILIGSIQDFRSAVKIRENIGFEKNGKKMYDILFNYERIIVYDNLDLELKKYYQSQNDQIYYKKIFWVFYELGNFILDFLLIWVNIFIFMEYNNINDSSFLKNKHKINELSMLLKSFEKYIKILLRDIAFLVNHYPNVIQSLSYNIKKELTLNKVHIRQIKKGIFIDNLSFYYKNNMVLNNVTVSILNGKKIAITGLSGCGKSTFMNILLGFYEYNGSLKIDDYEFNSIDSEHFRKFIAYVPQDSQLFENSILENIKVGNRNISNETIIELCKKYNYHKIFTKVGYNLNVGSRGKNISGGEKQKIAFMRAIIKDSPIICLDEPTANLDKATEIELIENLMMHSSKKTVLMIIHNLEVLKYFDLVFFFANHTLQSIGKFDDLYNNHKDFKEYYLSSITKSKIQ